MRVTATLTGATRFEAARTVTVKVGKAADSAAEGTDYTAVADQAITIAANAASGHVDFPLTPTDDAIDEVDETLSIEGALSGVTVTPTAITLEDDDTRGITVSAALTGVTVAEADDPLTLSTTENQATYTVVLDSEPTGTGTVTVNLESGDTDTATVAPASLTFDADDWNTAQTVTVTAVDDDLDNANNRRTTDITHTVSAADTDYAGETASPVTVTVTDDDAAPAGITLALDTNGAAAGTPDTVAEGAGATEVTVSATVDGATRYAQAQTVTVSVADGTATTPADYAAVADFTITIPRGATGHSETFTLTPADDAFDEPDETVNVTGASGSITVTPAVLTITDNDDPPTAVTLTVDADTGTTNVQDSLAEGGGVKTVRVTATLGGATRFETARTVTVNVGKAADSAAEGTDYTAVADQAITIAANTASGHVDFPLTPTDDAVDEVDETLSIEGALSGVTVTPTAITLEDDDTRGITVSAALTGVTVAEADDPVTTDTTENQAAYTVVLDSAPTGTVTVNLESEDTDVATVAPARLTFTTGNWNTAQGVTVTAVADNADNANDRRTTDITHTVSAASTDYAGETAAPVTVTVTDDEGAPTATLVLTPATIDESGADNRSTVTATLSGPVSAPVTVTVATAPGTGTVAADYTVTANKVLTIAAGATTSTGMVTITAVDNAVDAPDKTVTVSGTASGGGVAAPANQVLTIADDDTRGITVSAATSGVTVAEADNTATTNAMENRATYTVVLDSEPTGTGTVTLNIKSDATDIATVAPASLAFDGDDWSTAKTVTVTATDDDLDNANNRRATRITHTVSAAATDYASETADPVAVTVTDDDAPGGITLTVDADTGAAGVQDSLAEDGGVKTVRVTATLGGATRFEAARTVTVKVGKAADSAAEGTDYTAVADRAITIAATAASGHVDFPLTPTDDAIDEADETLSIEGALTGVTVTPTSLTLTDDDAPTVSLALGAAAINESGANNSTTVTASLSSSAHETVTLAVAAAPGADTVAGDFTLTGSALTIAAGQTASTGAVTIAALDNSIVDPGKTVIVSATAAGGGVANPADRTLSITDDDSAGLLLILSSATLSVPENGSAGYTVRLATQPTAAVTVAISGYTGTDLTLDKTSLTFGASDWNQAQTVAVSAGDDDDGLPDRATLTHTAQGGGYDSKQAQLDVATVDDDTAGLDLSVTTLTVMEGGSGSYTVALLTQPSAAVTVAISGYTGTDLTLDKTSLTFGASDWNQAQTVAVSAGQDSDGLVDTETLTHTAQGGGYDTITADLTVHTSENYTAPTAVSLSAQPDTVAEDGGAQTITVTAAVAGSTHFLEQKTVRINVAGGTAVATTDYEPVSGFDLTIAAGATSGAATFTLTPVDNNQDAPNKTIQVTGTLGGVTVTGTEITLTDDEETPEVDISINSVAVVEGETARFTLTLSEAQGVAATVLATTKDGTAKQSRDYRHQSRRVTIPAGDTSATFEVRTIEDKVQEGDESFKVRLSSPRNAVIKKGVGYGSIGDDDMPELRLGNALVEEGQPMTFELSIVPASNTAFTLNYFTQDKTARAGMDYIAIDAESITIDAGVTAKQITVQTLDDLIDEPYEEFRLLVTLPLTMTVIGTGTIFNDDAPPTLTIADASANEGDVLVFPVSLSGASSYPVSVDWEVTPATAMPGEDYVAESGTLQVPAGKQHGVIEVVSVQDLLDEPDETLNVTLSGLEHAVPGDPFTAVGTIVDDDAPPTLTIADASVNEGDVLVFPVSLSGASGYPVSVDWALAPGSATADEDYVAATGALSIPAGAGGGVIEVASLQDLVDEPDETLTVTLSESQRAFLGEAVTAVGTIRDDDEAPVLTVTDTVASEGETLRFPVSLSGVSGYPVSVDWELTPATATPGEDYVVARGTLTIPAGEDGGVIEVVVLQDLLDELDETLTLVMSAPQQVRMGEAARALGTIVDDDAAPVLSVEGEDGDMVVAAEEGQALVFILRLSAPSARIISVDWTIDPGTATVGEDYLATSGAVRLAPGETITRVEVMTLDDQKLEEAQETVLLTLLNPVNVALEERATGYIADNDAAAVQRLAQTNEAILPQVTAVLLRERIDQVVDCLGGDSPARSAGATLGSLLQRLPASSAELQRDERSWWERLGGTRFKTRLKPDEAAAGEEADGGYDITVCGGLDWRRLGDARRGLDWDGALYDAHLGGYLRLSETDRLGLNVSQSYVSLDYEDRDHAVQGDWELSLTGVQPYFSRQWEDGRSVWAMAGWGTGELTLSEAELRQEADAAAWQAALGGVLPLQWGQGSPGGWQRSLQVKSDVWWGRLELDGNESLLQSLSSSTVGGRALLESIHQRELVSGANLSLETGAGLRYDDGAGDAGLEWTGGVGYSSAGQRFETNVDARALLLGGHTKEWGFSAQARLKPRVDGSGWSFAVAPGWGQTQSMAEALWAGEWTSAQVGMGRPMQRAGMNPDLSVSNAGMTSLSRGAERARPTLNAEMGYGFRLPWQRGLLTPFSGFRSASGGKQVRLGMHWQWRPGLRLELDAEYQLENGHEQDDAALFLRYVIGN